MYFKGRYSPKYPDHKPKWHVFNRKGEGSVWVANCGYQINVAIYDPLIREVIKTANLKCKKCTEGDKK